jgi:hypothetical protein
LEVLLVWYQVLALRKMKMKAVWMIVITLIQNVKILTSALHGEAKNVMERVHVHKILNKKEIANQNLAVLVRVIIKIYLKKISHVR